MFRKFSAKSVSGNGNTIKVNVYIDAQGEQIERNIYADNCTILGVYFLKVYSEN